MFPNNNHQWSQTRVPVLRAALLGWPTLESGSLRRWEKPRVAGRIRAPCSSPSAACFPARRSSTSWEDTRWRSSGTSAGTERRGNLEATAGPRIWTHTGTPVYVHPWDRWQYPCRNAAWGGFPRNAKLISLSVSATKAQSDAAHKACKSSRPKSQRALWDQSNKRRQRRAQAQMTATGWQLEKRRCWTETAAISRDVQFQLPATIVCPPESRPSNYLRCARPADHVGGESSAAEAAFSQTLLFWKPLIRTVRQLTVECARSRLEYEHFNLDD